MSVDSSPSNKKHRVIAWKPEGADNVPSSSQRFPRWVRVTGMVAAALFVLLAVRTGYVLWELENARMAGQRGLAGAPGSTFGQDFADRSRAEFARSEAMRAIDVIAKTTPDHPAIVNYLVTIDKLRNEADRALGSHNFAVAVERYGVLTREAKGLATALEDRRKAREGYDKFIVNVDRLQRFKSLDPAVFTSAITSAGAGQSFLDKGSFSLGREKIDEALATLLGLEKAIAAELEDNLAIGRAALANGDGRAAKLAYNFALELQPNNELAAKGLARAEHIEQVFALLKGAETAEAAGQLEAAQKNFEQAFALDAQSATAQAGISRTKSAIKTRDFESALASATAAREAKDWDKAIAGYQAALKVIPDDKDVKKALADARVSQREDKIQGMLESAYNFERDYNWEAAKRTYLELIKYEPGQTDAEEGLLRTGRVIRAILVFDKKVEEARSHAQRANYQLAIIAFNEAMASKPSYLELSPEQNQLKNVLERQSRPVQISFVSDEKTYVTISGVRMLNKFDQTTVPLLPGNYEIIGRRKGYEEVRESLRVRADEPIPPITIIANKRL